jgi:iron complex outermembrane receptor protein/outer membrane receptor for ferrienterochelin and colicins
MLGGDMLAIQHKADSMHTYFEKNNTIRNTTNFEFEKKWSAQSKFKLEQSLSFFDRQISIPNYQFSGFNTQSFTHASYVLKKGKHVLISGINLVYDKFEDHHEGILDAKSFTKGVYTQHTFDINEKIKLESGLRMDRVHYDNNGFSKNQTFVLPRVSALIKLSNKLSTRIGGGLGYKIPTIFTEQTETNQYQNILPLQNVEAERSFGGTFDIQYKTALGENLSVSMNQMFFHTQINKPLVLLDTGSYFSFRNASKPVTTSGFETNLKLVFKENFKLLAGYTYTHTKAAYLTGNTFLPLLPKDKLNLCLIYEKEDNCKFGLEGYMTNKQYLSNGTQTPLYWEFGFMAEKTIYEHYIFFINFENFTDTRQSRYKRVVNEPHNSPTFDEIWTHTEGFVFNGGFKVKF